MKIVFAGVLGGIVMFIWTSVAHMFLPLGEAGIGEIPNGSALLGAMQSNIGEQSGLYIFPGPGVGKNATRQEKNEAMKRMPEKMAANPSGILMYHAPGRPFTFGKWLGIEFATELLESILVVFLLAQTAIASFAGRNTRRHRDQRFVLELVRLSLCLHCQLRVHPGNWISVCRHCCRLDVAEARSRSLKLSSLEITICDLKSAH
jgi:hypothetical protein